MNFVLQGNHTHTHTHTHMTHNNTIYDRNPITPLTWLETGFMRYAPGNPASVPLVHLHPGGRRVPAHLLG